MIGSRRPWSCGLHRLDRNNTDTASERRLFDGLLYLGCGDYFVLGVVILEWPEVLCHEAFDDFVHVRSVKLYFEFAMGILQ